MKRYTHRVVRVSDGALCGEHTSVGLARKRRGRLVAMSNGKMTANDFRIEEMPPVKVGDKVQIAADSDAKPWVGAIGVVVEIIDPMSATSWAPYDALVAFDAEAPVAFCYGELELVP